MNADRSSSKETADQASNQENQNSTSPLKAAVTKSYDCIFCKRGFSNAQALGGHMNIHRKDRARPNKPINKAPLALMDYVPMCIKELALFVERPSSQSVDDRASSGPVPVVEELDLELRLGPERSNIHDSMRLREFL
ncbi:uncharacterized protein A4U43_C08F35570 [Asparagus officinalis]|uniref:zinc finger protein 5-like n=1 Tax=Asparagus officinalis TaxID=4686 RepID=UPI00098E1E83|nr:zinc finger protein 5-like [Asparagus officinalis]ONK61980.1 uncharacterized protein A4U43_C08F35570 [Asparagus officinalis]